MNVDYVDHMGNDLAVVNAARVSFAKTSELVDNNLQDKDQKLINYLAKHKHWTPFAHTAISLRIQAPIPIRTQCFKHKIGLVENEESRRYISSEPSYFIPSFREKVKNKKQGSGRSILGTKGHKLQQRYLDHMEDAIALYTQFLDNGVCEEQARFLLPQGVEVEWIWTGNLVSFANFYAKRSSEDAQKEIQSLAHKVSQVIQPLFPYSWKALTS